jgi:hypothetical protein
MAEKWDKAKVAEFLASRPFRYAFDESKVKRDDKGQFAVQSAKSVSSDVPESESSVLPGEHGSEDGFVWRMQPKGSELHGQKSMDSNDEEIEGVFAFDNLNELAAVDWFNEKDMELVKIKVSKGDTFRTSDQEGIGLRSGKGEIVGRMPFDDVRSASKWAQEKQRSKWK